MVLSGNIKNDAVILVCALLTGLSGKEGTYQIRHRFFLHIPVLTEYGASCIFKGINSD